MTLKSGLTLFLLISISVASAQTILAPGEQPQITVDARGLIRLVYGEKDKVFFTTSKDNGKTFDTPQLIGQVSEMHLGMTRGPQLATSRDFSVVTAMDKKGNIHSFRLSHKSGKWQKIKNVNDVDASAPEGLMSISADDQNNFYAVWLDLREDRKNNIGFSSLGGNSEWIKNKFAYKSPEDHVCECCKPTVAVKGTNISIMFRNWLRGSRDLYLINSTDGGKTFSSAQKLGNGTWQLKGCPMDGGGVTIDSHNQISTAWQREGQVFYAEPGKPEQKIGDGRHVGLTGKIITWERGSDLIVKVIDQPEQKIGEGTALKVLELQDKTKLLVWEANDKIVFKKI
jgi:hypothetical protein